MPDTVLLNGGVFHAHALVQRLTQQLSDWRGSPVRVLHNRCELRLPGADVNPYLALSGMIAAGLHGIDNELPREAAVEGNATR